MVDGKGVLCGEVDLGMRFGESLERLRAGREYQDLH